MDLSHVRAITALPVSDLDRAVAWYQGHLGAEPSETDEDGALFECGGGTSFFVYESQFAGTNKGTALMLQVDDFDAAFSDLRSGGVSFEEYDFGEFKTVDGVMTSPGGRRSAWFKDLDGNIIGMGAR